MVCVGGYMVASVYGGGLGGVLGSFIRLVVCYISGLQKRGEMGFKMRFISMDF